MVKENSLTVYKKQRIEGYEKVLRDIQGGHTNHSEFENKMKATIYRWWANWTPAYEGWLEIADGLYAPECVIDAIGDEPQIYKDYRLSMKHQRDAFTMDMGPINNCLVEGDTLAISYNMYLTANADMGPLVTGNTYKIKVSEFNKFAYVNGEDKDPMVVHLLLTATTPGV